MTHNGSSDEGGRSPPGGHVSDGGVSDDVPLTPSAVFGILADKRDRFVLYLLEERGGTVPLDELAAQTAAWENDTKPELITKETERRVHQRLYHAAVPKLVDYGLVTTTQDSEAVTLTDRGERLEPYLEFAKEREPQDVEAFLEQGQPDCQ